MIPLNDLSRVPPTAAERAAIERVLDRGRYALGPEVEAFEQAWAARCGRAWAVGVANGTDALELALRALGVEPGQEVITAANAGGYTTTACRAIGALPVYVDVDPHTLLLDPARLAAAGSPQTRVVVVTHLYGLLAPLEPVLRVARARGWRVLEDCAQAHGARRGSQRAGGAGDLAAFSFYPTKNLGAVGDAGAVVGDDPTWGQRLRALRQYGWTEPQRVEHPGGRNSRLDELQAAVLHARLPTLDAGNARRRAIRAQLIAAAGDGALAPVAAEALGPEHVAHLAVFQHPARERARAHFAARGVATGIHYPCPDPRQPASAPHRVAEALDVTEAAAQRVLTLPCFPTLRDDELEVVCEAVATCP